MDSSGDTTPPAGSAIDPGFGTISRDTAGSDPSTGPTPPPAQERSTTKPAGLGIDDGRVEVPEVQIATPLRETSLSRPTGAPLSDPTQSGVPADVGGDRTEVRQHLQHTAELPGQAMAEPVVAQHGESAVRAVGPPSRWTPGSDMFSALLIPGVRTWRRRRLTGALLFGAGVVLPVALVVWLVTGRDRLVSLALSDRFLLAAILIAIAAFVARVVAVIEVSSAWRRVGRGGLQTAMAFVALLALAVPVGFGVVRVQQARGFLDAFFTTGGVDQPLFVTGPGGAGVLGPDGTVIGPDGQPVASSATGLRTVLLIGGDGGPNRSDNRTDSMMLVMVDQATGRTGLVSVARNLNRMQFPPATVLAERYPGGFPDLANAIFTAVERDPALMEAYSTQGLHPPAVALSQAIGYSLGVTVDDYFFVDLEGFSDVIDAVGGVTLELDREYPIPPNRADPSRPVPPTVGPGVVWMDGPLATGYARTRALDSDIGRTTRQRQLLSALVNQTSAPEALARLPQITEAADGAFLTSLSRGQLPDLMRSLSGPSVVESMGLATPLVNSGNPNWDEIRSIVNEVRQALLTGQPSRFAVHGE